MEVRLLGTVEVATGSRSASVPGPQLRGLLAVLALRAGTTVSVAQLVEAVWGEDAPPMSAVQVAVSKLRRVLADAGAPDCIVRRPGGYELAVDPLAVDAVRFEDLVDRARRHQLDWAVVERGLERALAGWSGSPLGGVPDTSLLSAERTRLEELHRLAVEDLLDARIERGEHARVVPDAEALVAAEPLRERRWALLLRALYGSGRQAEALSAYHRAREVLVEEVGAEPGAELRALHAAMLAQDGSLAPTSPLPGPVGRAFRRRGNLRHPLQPCIGRSSEWQAIGSLLDTDRLVTILGPGGVGKTRLALDVAWARLDETVDGTWWVDLAAVRDAEEAVHAVERTLDLGDPRREQEGAVDAICAALRDGSALLVLDNCEHVLPALGRHVAELLAGCPELRILTTSREALGISGESAFLLEPLDPMAAVELFQARVLVPIDGDPDTSEVVEAICRRLDFLPLALELAAARAQHLRLDELLDRLVDRFSVLADGPRDAPAHQRSLEAVAAWSYGLLDEREQVVFERLSVFSDGATLDAATAVCAGDRAAGGEVEALLVRLVDKSLVVADRSGAVTRYRLLQTLADFAAARLVDRGAEPEVRRAHARWVRALAATVGWRARIAGPTVARIHDEDAAVRDAVTWAWAHDPVLALGICEDLAAYWFGAMRVSTGWDLLRGSITAAGDREPARRASALGWAVVFATLVQETGLADAFADEAWALESAAGDPERVGRLSLLRALAAGYRADGDLARWVASARSSFSAIDVPVAFGHLSFAEGAGHLVAGELESAAAHLGEAIEVFRREEDHLGLVLAVSRLGELAWRLEDLDLFADMHEQLLELGRESRTPGVVTGATARLALARLRQGDLGVAEQMAREALATSGDTFMPVINGYAFHTAGLVDLQLGHTAAGRDELRAAIDAFERGAGSVGVGQAALCWIDLSRSHLSGGDPATARSAAEVAEALARTTGDPWVCEQAAAQVRAVAGTS